MKPWEETWTSDAMTGTVQCGDGTMEVSGFRPVERARLAASAPDLARALLACDAILAEQVDWTDKNWPLQDAVRAADAALKKAGVR